MVIYWDDEEITGADKKIASIINDIEILVVKDLDEEKFSSLIVRLKGISEHFPENVKRYIDEIRDVVEFTIKHYKREGAETPDISFLYG